MRRLALLVLLALPLFAEPRRFIVEFRQRPSALRLERDAGGLRIRRQFTRALNGVAIELKEGQSIDEIAALPWVAAIHADTPVEAFDANAAAVAPSRAVGVASGGEGVVVAVIDSGIDYNHPALGGGLGPGRKVIGGYDFVNNDEDPMDDYRHGTHVAGIIAAAGGEVAGVAPNVKLLAYKVLDHTGRGSMSDVIAAIERALDPNGDGDLADRAGVINLSLGAVGHPDDPTSRAVDNAVAAGVVVCVAAGNSGTFHSIGSPAGAASAITVGASNGENGVADFSSRGPATGNGAIKPDILAPGVEIRSTLPGGRYGLLSGTSMATPYVAGLAALLRGGHPDWTPARIKAALVSTALPIDGIEAMTQGSGVVSAARAFASDLPIEPTQINFGLNGSASSSWHASRTIVVRNESASARTIRLRAEGQSSAIAIAVAPEITLAPGQSREVEVAITTDGTLPGRPPTQSLSFGGAVVLEWDGGVVRVPWAFIRAARATVTYAGATPGVLWRIPSERYASWAQIGAEGFETLMEPGKYELAVFAQTAGDLRVILPGEQFVEGDVRIALSDADAPHEIRMDTFPDKSSSATTLYSIQARLAMSGVSLPLELNKKTLHASSFDDAYALLLTESYVDSEAHTIHVAQYPPLRSLTAGTVLRMLPGDFARQEVRVHAPSSLTGSKWIQIMPRDWPRRLEEFAPKPPESLFVTAQSEDWSATLFMTPESHDDAGSGVQLAVTTGVGPTPPLAMNTPVIRRNADGFFATRAFEAPPLPVLASGGEPLAFGDGVVHSYSFASISGNGIRGAFELEGARNEYRRRERGVMTYRVTDPATGAELSTGTVRAGVVNIPLSRTGRLRAELRTDDYQLAGRSGTATLALQFENTSTPASPPSITSLAILDGFGRHATDLAKNANGWLYFSAADHDQLQYRRIAEEATTVFFRMRGNNTWVQLTTVATGEEPGGVGTTYRVDLRDALRVEGEVELAIEVADEQGSTATWTVAPAFVVGPAETLPRRRSVRH